MQVLRASPSANFDGVTPYQAGEFGAKKKQKNCNSRDGGYLRGKLMKHLDKVDYKSLGNVVIFLLMFFVVFQDNIEVYDVTLCL